MPSQVSLTSTCAGGPIFSLNTRRSSSGRSLGWRWKNRQQLWEADRPSWSQQAIRSPMEVTWNMLWRILLLWNCFFYDIFLGTDVCLFPAWQYLPNIIQVRHLWIIGLYLKIYVYCVVLKRIYKTNERWLWVAASSLCNLPIVKQVSHLCIQVRRCHWVHLSCKAVPSTISDNFLAILWSAFFSVSMHLPRQRHWVHLGCCGWGNIRSEVVYTLYKIL